MGSYLKVVLYGTLSTLLKYCTKLLGHPVYYKSELNGSRIVNYSTVHGLFSRAAIYLSNNSHRAVKLTVTELAQSQKSA
jgi:hypothetical protein